jgi:hypothetical protein
MRRLFLLLAPLVLALGLARPAAALTEDEATALLNACTVDIGQYCAEARRGGRRLIACFFANADRLSPSCRAQMDATPSAQAVLRNYANFLVQSCGAEAARLCPDVTPGRGRLAACLGAQQDRLSPACANALNASGFR